MIPVGTDVFIVMPAEELIRRKCRYFSTTLFLLCFAVGLPPMRLLQTDPCRLQRTGKSVYFPVRVMAAADKKLMLRMIDVKLRRIQCVLLKDVLLDDLRIRPKRAIF